MVSLAALWLPIVLSAVIVFVASSIMHMLLPYHQSDYRKLPDEDRVRAALRAAGLTQGLYIFPHTHHKEMNSPAMVEKYKEGPVGMMSIAPNGPPAMPKFLGLWFVYTLIISFFVAYLTGHTVALGTPYPAVFRVVGTAAFLVYGLANISNGIWRGIPWTMVAKDMIDGLVYALLTAGTFGWLWPR
jgi:hypothetical protein